MTTCPVRLLFVVNSLEFGGAEKHVVTLVNRLDPDRFFVSLCYLKRKAALLNEIDVDRLRGEVACCDVQRRIDLEAVKALATRIREEKIDVVVCTNAYSLLYGWLARLVSGLQPRLVEIFHTTSPGSVAAACQLRLYRGFFRASDHLVYVSENQRSYWHPRLARRGPDTVIHNGIDVEHFADCYSAEYKASLRARLGVGASDYLIGLCAAMRPEKAHLDLIRAIGRLAADSVSVSCLLIGDGPERQRLESEIRAMNLQDRVKITGFVSDVRPYVACCDVMAIVSHHVETFSIAALEAMAMGKPMIMSRIGGADEQIANGENGYLFEAGDLEALEHRLLALKEELRRASMGMRARDVVVTRFSVERMVENYACLFLAMADTPADRDAVSEHARPA